MYVMYTPVYMWEVEPTLYWRVKWLGKWTWKRAKLTDWVCCDGHNVEPITPADMEVDVSE